MILGESPLVAPVPLVEVAMPTLVNAVLQYGDMFLGVNDKSGDGLHGYLERICMLRSWLLRRPLDEVIVAELRNQRDLSGIAC